MKNGVRKEYDSPELTWEEKNPISYYYYTSAEIEELKRISRAESKAEKSNQASSYEKRNREKKGN